ncbi:hypothetical protein JMJ56_25950 [Belnapia sp. T18]|uniref:Uncharacterized protein n=1 Tax=Belnapia arida TaxID=2804533 RepID=A0ABS1U9S7_9PROT|nr:hypothetical protein [Belnapia arida]MBL6081440.1 hypothetical protein [Belnapia arida]
MQPKLLDFQPAFEAALPPDWVLIGRCRAGEVRGAAPGTVGGGCFVLAHAEIGVALVDLLPMRTPQAEAHLRRLLNAVDFSAQCRGYLPVIQCEVTPQELGSLHARIEDAFTYDQVLTIADRGRWVGVLRRILQASVTWEALDGLLPEPGPDRRAWRPRMLPPAARVLRAGMVGCGVLGIFGLGFVTALLMPQEPVAALPSPGTGFGVVAEAARVVEEPGPLEVATPALPEPRTVALAEPRPVILAEPRPVALAEPVPLPAPGALPPETPPVAVAATARHPVRVPLPIDRRCSDAVFRFQQGASLTAQEMAHVRQGCASLR